MDYEHVKKQLGYGIQTESKDNAIKALEQLQAKVAELEAENARLRTVPMKYRRMQFNAQLQDENNELRTQLAKAEQRVAEACAKWIDGYAGIHQKEMLSDTAKSFADALRRGEWRKFVKEV